MDPLQELILFMSLLVSLALVTAFLFMLFKVVRTSRELAERNLADEEDFFSNLGRISSDVGFWSSGAFTKNTRLEFIKIRSYDARAIAISKGDLYTFSKLHKRLSLTDASATFAVHTSNAGTILCRAEKGILSVRHGQEQIGKINYLQRIIMDPKGNKIGEFEQDRMQASGLDIVGIPFISRRGNFSVSQSVSIAGKYACTINFRKWADAEEPLLKSLDQKIGKREKVLIFSLAVFEWMLSLNLR